MAKSRPDSHSIKGAKRAFEGAHKTHDWPESIDLPTDANERVKVDHHWRELLATRAYDDWTSYDLSLAAEMSCVRARAAMLTRQLEYEGEVLESSNGNPVKNPLIEAVKVLQGRQVQISRALGISAPAVARNTLRTTAKAEQRAKETISAEGQVDDDDFLPRGLIAGFH